VLNLLDAVSNDRGFYPKTIRL